MLEMEVIENQDMKMQMITTLQTTAEGKRMYAELCDRQIALRELVKPFFFCFSSLSLSLSLSFHDTVVNQISEELTAVELHIKQIKRQFD